MKNLFQSHTIGIALAVAGAFAVHAVPYDVNDNATRHLVLTASGLDNPSVLQGHALVYRFIDGGSGGGGVEQGVNPAAFDTFLSSDGITFTINWDASLWNLQPAFVLVKTATRWGTWELGGWSDDVDSLVLVNETIRNGRGPTAPLATLESIAIYGTVAAKDLSGGPSTTPPGGPVGGPPGGGTGVPDAGSAFALLGLGTLGAAWMRRKALR